MAAPQASLGERMTEFAQQLLLKTEYHYTQNEMALCIYDGVISLIRELKSEARTEPEIEAAFQALRKEYRRQTRPPGTASGTPGAAYVRAYRSEYYK